MISAEKVAKSVRTLPLERQHQVLRFVKLLQREDARKRNGRSTEPDLRADPEHIALGYAGAKLAAMAWSPEDFSAWPGYRNSTRPKRRGRTKGNKRK
jgi:hypothetical protein